MNRMTRLILLADRLSDVAGFVASVLVLAATGVCVVNALLRYGFDFGSNAWIEAQAVMFGMMIYLGGAQTLRMNEHIRIDILYGARSERTRLWIDLLGILLLLLPVTMSMTWFSWSYFASSFASGETSPNTGGLPLWPAKLAIPLGFGLLSLQGLAELLRRVGALRGLVQVDVSYEKPQQ